MRTTAAAIGMLMILAGPVRAASPATGFSGTEPEITPGFIVYYFHNHMRCETCLGMESMVTETVNYDFTDDVEMGLLTMRTVEFREYVRKGLTAFMIEESPKGKS